MRYTQQLQRVHPNVLAKALSRGIVHQDNDLLVISKPYGVPVHGKDLMGEAGRLLLLSDTTRAALTHYLWLSKALHSKQLNLCGALSYIRHY